MDKTTAAELLKSPATWCQGAAALAQLGDHEALLLLIQAYETRYEGSKVCLLEAMRALAPQQGARDLFDQSHVPDEQRMAVHLMELFPEEQHLSRLEQAVASTDLALRRQAARSLVAQPQTNDWERIMQRSLGNHDEWVRSWVIEGLGYCRRESSRQMLRDHLAAEQSQALQKKIQKILSS